MPRLTTGFAPGLAGFPYRLSVPDRDLVFQGRVTSSQRPRQAAVADGLTDSPGFADTGGATAPSVVTAPYGSLRPSRITSRRAFAGLPRERWIDLISLAHPRSRSANEARPQRDPGEAGRKTRPYARDRRTTIGPPKGNKRTIGAFTSPQGTAGPLSEPSVALEVRHETARRSTVGRLELAGSDT
jgi:hypothetical protein